MSSVSARSTAFRSFPAPVSLALIALFVAACTTGPFAPTSPYADTVFYGEHIHTVDPATAGANAVAIQGEEIVGVGAREDVATLVGPETRVVELGERALVPGFIDAHGHFTMAMGFIDMLNASSPPVGPMTSVEQIVEALSARIAELAIPPGQTVAGYGYDDSLLAEGRHPTRDDLDRASTAHPIVLIHVSGHLAATNSMALEIAGYDETTEDPYGGVIRRQPGTTIPDGVLEETAAHAAFAPLLAAAASASPREQARLVRRTIDYHAAYGITTVQDGASSTEVAKGLALLARFQPPAIDIAIFPAFHNEKDTSDLDVFGYSPEYRNGVRVAGVKFVLDGSPQGRTAWLTRPYDEGPPGADPNYVAYPMVEPDDYKKQVKRVLEAGIPILAHANGDAAIDLMIEGIEEGLDGESKDHRSVTIHAQLAREDQLDKMKALGIVPSFFAAHPFFWGDWHRKSFGDDRAMRISPLRSSLDRELPFTIHNDAPVVPPDMMLLMEIAMSRKTRDGVVLGEDQRVTFDEALYAITQGSAYQYFEEDRKGSITPGKRADLVVLAQDPAAVPVDAVGEVGIVETFARGRSIYAAE